jgi:hypothetical protein
MTTLGSLTNLIASATAISSIACLASSTNCFALMVMFEGMVFSLVGIFEHEPYLNARFSKR